jgi:hypothetical protein
MGGDTVPGCRGSEEGGWAALEDDRAEVLDVVRRLFLGETSSDEELLGGTLLEWERLVGPLPWGDRYEYSRTLERLEIRELDERCATVDAVVRYLATVKRGSRAHEATIEGPVLLDKQDVGWRVVDYRVNGRSRAETVVLGPLAEQRQPGVTARVLGLQRAALATQFAVELVDEGAGDVHVKHAYALVESQMLWKRLSVGGSCPAEDGRQSILASLDEPVDVDETLFAIALDVHSATGKKPFVMRVPVRRPEELVAQPPPRRLPPLRGSWPRHLLVYAAFTAALAWWNGWYAIVVPLFVAGSYYGQVRSCGLLPRRLDPIRYLIDATVASAIFFALWESPAVNLAVPCLIAGAVYFTLRPLRRRIQPTSRLVTALTIGSAWLFLLGTSTGRLSPCRLTGSNPSSAALSFAHAVYSDDLRAAAQQQLSGSEPVDPYLAKLLVHDARGRPVALRTPSSRDRLCRYFRSDRLVQSCFVYGPTAGGSSQLWIGVGCDGKNWRVYRWG